jgi:SNF2 family DNA or RNA helicase
VGFDYDGRSVAAGDGPAVVVENEARRMIVRSPEAEESALVFLRRLGFRPAGAGGPGPEAALDLAPRRLPGAVRELVRAGWKVEAEGKLYRTASAFRVEVASGIDWFELRGAASYDGVEVPLPALLAALRKGETAVLLGDGTFGILPEEWLQRYLPIAGLGEPGEDGLRFRPAQVGFLDALLAAMPEASCDEVFERARARLRSFEGVRPAEPPPGFQGTLRPYQKEGLGWFSFLREFGFGGCLADDMGLGKTVQVLALLEARRAGRRGRRKPSLVVAPRSLVFNWLREAERFTPRLRVLDNTGLVRARAASEFRPWDVVLATYGTLKRDVAVLKEADFDLVILDEAQAIKNAGTQAAKAVRLLKGDQRLVLSGTPIENHLGELWSLFEFLNPGMLGASSAFRSGILTARDPDGPARALLARALRPFILRRTKAQVARDLPEKTEQTITCVLEGTHRALYDDLREHYRSSLLSRVRRDGLAKSKIHVLEALLRLRQAACHPGLLDRKRAAEVSAKFEVLFAQLDEVLESGHKALVFSQFTSLLALVRARLDERSLRHAYLDGTMGGRRREEAVRLFQEDPGCPIFLASLKAGGFGLNLTAAEYVYLLDPWWNPAVEAQAIDRAHRIGQTRAVFAYRIVAAGTIEEKILQLQAGKRELADSILAADASLMRDLTREDLELLLS